MLCYVMLCYVMLCYVMLCMYIYIYVYYMTYIVNPAETFFGHFLPRRTIQKAYSLMVQPGLVHLG